MEVESTPAITAGLPAGLVLVPDAISPAEEAELLRTVEGFGTAPYAADPDNPRSSVSFGWKYDFRTDHFVACAPIPDALAGTARLAAALGAIDPDDIAECLVNCYEPGAIIQPHVDKPVFELVIGLSLGSEATMVFSLPPGPDGERTLPVALPPRSIYVMTGAARHVWRHSLPPMPARRWSLTFRTLSALGRARLAA